MTDARKDVEQTKLRLEQLRMVKSSIDLGKNLSLTSMYAVLVGILVSMSTTIIYQEFIRSLDARIRLMLGLSILFLLLYQLYHFYYDFHKKILAERDIDSILASLDYELKEKESLLSKEQTKGGQP